MVAATLTVDEHGAARHHRAALSVLAQLEAALTDVPRERAGVRLHDNLALASLLSPGSDIGRLATAHLGPAARPVRAVLFDKTQGMNWSLGWHQDRTLVVRTRHDMTGWGPWSIKAGLQHVEPPFEYIEGMVTLRIHLDPVPKDNAPLLIARGSHRLGRIPEHNIEAAVSRCATMACLAERGDAWIYATSIIHASAASAGHAQRRVLQVDYSATELPLPLEWLGL